MSTSEADKETPSLRASIEPENIDNDYIPII